MQRLMFAISIIIIILYKFAFFTFVVVVRAHTEADTAQRNDQLRVQRVIPLCFEPIKSMRVHLTGSEATMRK